MSKQPQINPGLIAEIQKLGQQVNTCNQDLNTTEAKIWYHQKESKKNQVVLSEVKQLPPTVPLYKAVGRMFVLSPVDAVKTDLERNIAAADAEVTQLEQKKTYLEKQKIDYEKGLRDLVAMIPK